jgi:5'(3')-deoxyribonucleotidase
MPTLPRIGIDLDGVLIDHREHKRKLAGEHGFALESWQANSNVMEKFVPEQVHDAIREPLYGQLTPHAPPVAGALQGLAALRAEVYIISARRPHSVRYAQDWLIKHRVYDAVPAERIYFCGGDEEKRGYCDRLGISLFLDDKVSVLDALPGKTKRVLFDEDGVAESLGVKERLHVVKDWDEFRTVLQGHA